MKISRDFIRYFRDYKFNSLLMKNVRLLLLLLVVFQSLLSVNTNFFRNGKKSPNLETKTTSLSPSVFGALMFLTTWQRKSLILVV